jgi:hypothetical protein
MKYQYTGPSWAVQSYDSPDLSIYPTNLSKEWKIACIDLSQLGSSILNRVEAVKQHEFNLPIIWVYNEPLLDLTAITGLTLDEFVTRKDWSDIREECNQYCLNQINLLPAPVLLIGAHSDIVNCNRPNITVAHPSWQAWLAEKAGMLVSEGRIEVNIVDGSRYGIKNCWGAEYIHRFLHENHHIDPDPSLLNLIWDVYYFWEELERQNWFFEVHPNKRGNVEFAKFLKPTVENFLLNV